MQFLPSSNNSEHIRSEQAKSMSTNRVPGGTTASGIFLAIIMWGGANAGPGDTDVPRVAFSATRAEVERIGLLNDVLRQKARGL